MENVEYAKPIGPWYRNYIYWSKLARSYIRAYMNIPEGAKHHAEFKAFAQFMGYRLVFESNLIEGEGLSSGETIKVVKECFPIIPDNYEIIRHFIEIDKLYLSDLLKNNVIEKMINSIGKYGLQKEKIIPSIRFSNKSRGFVEVYQHYLAYLDAYRIQQQFQIKRYRDILKEILKVKYGTDKDIVNKESKENIIAALSKTTDEELFTEDKIKGLHKIIARGLLPKDANVEAGEYRIDERMVGDFGVTFPSHELVPKCMEKFIKDANSLILSNWNGEQDTFKVAALISHEFVKIHPFPDFNGRISRLILMIVLMANGIPFAVTLRGDKRGRSRYLSSLRKANKHHITPYAALIAMRVAELFTEIDDNIILAGLPSILSFLPDNPKVH